MTDRQVTATAKDEDGDITALCNSAASWSPRTKAEAIDDIDDETHRYYVLAPDGDEVDIVVIDDEARGKYLRTDPDETTVDNLDDLPDCDSSSTSSKSASAVSSLKRPPVAPRPPAGRRVG